MAAQLARQYQAKLYLLHAIMPQIYAAGTGEALPELNQLNLQSARENLHNYAAHIPDVRAVKHEEIVTWDSPNGAIQSAVETNSVDLLVLGSHGRRGLAKLALGSVAEWAIRHVPCPTLIIGPQCKNPWHAVTSIVFATNLAAESLRSAQYASSMAQEYNSRITLFHVLPEAEPGELAAEAGEAALASLKELVPSGAREWCTPRFKVASGDVASAILNLARAEQADLIILGTRHKSFLSDHSPWTTVSAVVHSADCPVLVVPAFAG